MASTQSAPIAHRSVVNWAVMVVPSGLWNQHRDGSAMPSAAAHSRFSHFAFDEVGSRAMPWPCSMNRSTQGDGLEYGGFSHTRPSHGWARPSSSTV